MFRYIGFVLAMLVVSDLAHAQLTNVSDEDAGRVSMSWQEMLHMISMHDTAAIHASSLPRVECLPCTGNTGIAHNSYYTSIDTFIRFAFSPSMSSAWQRAATGDYLLNVAVTGNRVNNIAILPDVKKHYLLYGLIFPGGIFPGYAGDSAMNCMIQFADIDGRLLFFGISYK